jgi:hypothetical protein
MRDGIGPQLCSVPGYVQACEVAIGSRLIWHFIKATSPRRIRDITEMLIKGR